VRSESTRAASRVAVSGSPASAEALVWLGDGA